MAYFIEVLTLFSFFALIANIIKRKSIFDLIFIISTIAIGTVGEILNLFIYKATAYTDRVGIPLYIILGGSLIAWTYLKLPQILATKFKKNNLFMQIVLFLFLSILFPLIEIAGIKANLWYWIKPFPQTSIWWWIGVWKFYMIFLGIPVITAFFILSLKQYLQKLSNVIH